MGAIKFHKGHVPGLHGPPEEFILACGAPLLLEPPLPPSRTTRAPFVRWALRLVITTINEAALAYRRVHCRSRPSGLPKKDVLMVRRMNEWAWDRGDDKLKAVVQNELYANKTWWKGRGWVREQLTFPYYLRLPESERVRVEEMARRW